MTTRRFWFTTGIGLALAFLTWSAWLVASSLLPQAEVSRKADLVRRLAELEDAIHELEQALPAWNAPARSERWTTAHDRFRAHAARIADGEPVPEELAPLVDRANLALAHMGSLHGRLARAKPGSPERFDAEDEFRRERNRTLDAVRDTSRRVQAQMLALSSELAWKWAFLRALAMVAGVLGVATLVVLDLYLRSVSRHQDVQEELQTSMARFGAVVESLPFALLMVDMQGRIVLINGRGEAWFGYSREELRGQPVETLVPEAIRDRHADFVRGFIAAPQVRAMGKGRELHGVRKDGSRFPVEIGLVPMATESEMLVLAAIVDITERKRAEEALQEREEQLHIFIEHSPVALAMFDRQMRYLHASRRWKSDLKLGERDLRGASHYEVFPEIPPRWLEIHRRGLAGEVLSAEEDRFERADGAEQWLRWEVRPWRDSANAVGGILIFFEEITQRKLAEQRLRESEQRFRDLFENSPDAIFVEDHAGMVLDVNHAACVLHGLTREILAGRHVLDLVPPSQREEVAATFHTRTQGDLRPFEGFSWTSDQRAVPVEIRAGRIDYLGQPALLLHVRDITERKRAEEELRLSEERFRLVAESAPTAMLAVDAGGVIVLANSQMEVVSGYSRAEIIGQPVELLLPERLQAGHIESRRKFLAEVTPLRLASERELVVRRKDGTEVPVEIGLAHVHTEQGTLVLAGINDITGRKRAEEGLRTSLHEKETLLKEVHHRVKNNLAVIDSLLTMQAERTRDPAVSLILRDACNRVHSMALIHETLYRARDLADVDLASYVRRLCDHLFDSYGVDRSRIRLELAVTPMPLDMDLAVPLGLLLTELVSNILKHAFPADRPGHVIIRFSLETEGRTRIIIADDGVGLPAGTNLRQLRSLGLRLVHGLVRQIGGTVDFASPDPTGEGTVVTVTFPSASHDGGRHESQPEDQGPHRRG